MPGRWCRWFGSLSLCGFGLAIPRVLVAFEFEESVPWESFGLVLCLPAVASLVLAWTK
jgi:hypothetical protein